MVGLSLSYGSLSFPSPPPGRGFLGGLRRLWASGLLIKFYFPTFYFTVSLSLIFKTLLELQLSYFCTKKHFQHALGMFYLIWFLNMQFGVYDRISLEIFRTQVNRKGSCEFKRYLTFDWRSWNSFVVYRAAGLCCFVGFGLVFDLLVRTFDKRENNRPQVPFNSRIRWVQPRAPANYDQQTY